MTLDSKTDKKKTFDIATRNDLSIAIAMTLDSKTDKKETQHKFGLAPHLFGIRILERTDKFFSNLKLRTYREKERSPATNVDTMQLIFQRLSLGNF